MNEGSIGLFKIGYIRKELEIVKYIVEKNKYNEGVKKFQANKQVPAPAVRLTERVLLGRGLKVIRWIKNKEK